MTVTYNKLPTWMALWAGEDTSRQLVVYAVCRRFTMKKYRASDGTIVPAFCSYVSKRYAATACNTSPATARKLINSLVSESNGELVYYSDHQNDHQNDHEVDHDEIESSPFLFWAYEKDRRNELTPEVTTKLTSKLTQEQTIITDDKTYTDEFESLWASWHRRRGKAGSYKAYKKLLKKHTHSRIAKAASLYLASDGPQKGFCCAMYNWINRGEADEYLEALDGHSEPTARNSHGLVVDPRQREEAARRRVAEAVAQLEGGN